MTFRNRYTEGMDTKLQKNDSGQARIMPSIYLTGSSGLVGTRVLDLLKDTFSFVSEEIDLTCEEETVTFWEGLTDVNTIIHLAAFTNVAKSEEEKDNLDGLCYRLNVEATERIAHLAKEKGQHLLYISTGNVFNGDQYEPYTEADSPSPLGWYAMTKYLGERAVVESGCKYTIVRMGFPFGRKFESKLDWIQLMVKKLQLREQVSLFTDQWLSAMWIDDLVRVLEQLLIRGGENQIYHVGTPPVITPYEAGVMVADLLGIDASLIVKGSLSTYIAEHPEKAHLYVKNCSLHTGKFEHAFGFHFKDLATGLKESLKVL